MTPRMMAVPLLAIAALLPVAVFIFASTDPGLHSSERIVTTVSLDEDELNFFTLTENSELVIEGNILSSSVFTKRIDENQAFPDIYTKYEIKVAEVLKGETDQSTISIVMHGGEIDNRVSMTGSVPVKDSDTVIMFLEKNGAYYTGADNYNPIAPVQGVFLIKDNIAKSGIFDDVSKSDLKDTIESAQ